MASVQITMRQVRSSSADGYQVYTEILDGAGQTEDIDAELFVFTYIDGTNDTYMHVAEAADVAGLPKKNDTGWDSPGQFYRASSSTLTYTTIVAADEQALVIKARLQDLATEYDVDLEDFETVGTDYDYASEDNDVTFRMHQIRSQLAVDSYQVDSEIVASPAPVGIARELFLFANDGGGPTTDAYVRVVNVNDLQTYPTYAGLAGEDYYRYYQTIQTFELVENADTHAETIRTDLDALAEEWDEFTDEFEGDETVTYYS